MKYVAYLILIISSFFLFVLMLKASMNKNNELTDDSVDFDLNDTVSDEDFEIPYSPVGLTTPLI